jgi:hypothetical protein
VLRGSKRGDGRKARGVLRPDGSPALRGDVLASEPSSFGFRPRPGQPSVWGVVIDLAFSNGTVSMAALMDGSTSMYTGDGAINGGGSHRAVVDAAKALLKETADNVDHFQSSVYDHLPPLGTVQFFALTYGGRFVANAPEDDLRERRHPLSGLFFAAHSVITALREATG